MKHLRLCTRAVLVLGLLSSWWAAAQPLHAQGGGQKLALQAKEALEKNCARCHGTSKAAGLDVRDYKLILKGTKKRTFLVPKDAKKSKIWEMIESGEMPQDGEMADAEKKVVKQWIEEGAEWTIVAVKRPYVSTKEVLTAIRDHLREAEHDDRPYLRYFVTANLFNNPTISDEMYGRHLAALSKALNSLHWKKPIVLPRQVDKYGTVFVIDLRDLDWDKKGYEKYDRWAILLQRYPYGLDYEDSDDDAMVKIDKEIGALGRRTLVYMRADWFVAHATRPPLYEQVLRLPQTAYELETKLGVDVASNFRRNRLVRAGYAKSFVSEQNRMVERHDALYDAYWKSYDFKKGGEKGNLMDFPLGPLDFGNGVREKQYLDIAFKHDGGEMIFNLPNGLQGYYLTDGKGNYIEKGPIDVVSDSQKTSGTNEIFNGLSCMFCHKKGMIDSVIDEVRLGNSVAGLAKQKVKRLYPGKTIMLKYVEEDSELFLASLKKAIGPFLAGGDKDKPVASVEEPVGELMQKYYNPDLKLATVAYELGYENPAELKAAIGGNEQLRAIGMRGLIVGGGVKREDWEQFKGQSLYQKAARYLNIATAKKSR